jgi:hypothetical protein
MAPLLRTDQNFAYPSYFLPPEYKALSSPLNSDKKYLNLLQLMPAKKGCAMISSTPLTPSRSFESATNFLN